MNYILIASSVLQVLVIYLIKMVKMENIIPAKPYSIVIVSMVLTLYRPNLSIN